MRSLPNRERASMSYISPSRVPNAPISRRRTRRTWDEVLDSDLPSSFPALGSELTPPSFINPPDSTSELLVELPGEGLPSSGCGDLIQVKCNDCGHKFEVEHDCGMRYCPRCYEKWAKREAMAATDVARRRHAQYPDDLIVHAEISFKGEPDDVFKNRPRAIKIAKKHGIMGFSVVGHHVRGNPGDWRIDGYLHYHIVGVVARDDGFRTLPDLIEADFIEHNGTVTGTYDWTFKVIKQNRGRSWYVHPSRLYKLYFYQLQHASIQHGRHALTWAGTWWISDDIEAASVGGTGEAEPIMCPKCGSTDVDLQVEGSYEKTENRYRERRGAPNDFAGSEFLKIHQAGGGRCNVDPYFKSTDEGNGSRVRGIEAPHPPRPIKERGEEK